LIYPLQFLHLLPFGMSARKNHRILFMILGLLACGIIIFAGGFRIEVISKKAPTEVAAKEGQAQKSESKTYLSTPSEAIPGSSAGITFDCPDYKVVITSVGTDDDEKSGTFINLVNNYLRVLVRSLIRTNAP
jgi:hypothetical protein